MALFNEALIHNITTLVRSRHAVLSQALGVPSTSAEDEAGSEPSPLQRDLALLIAVANGQQLRAHATAATLQEVEAAFRRLVDLLLGNALGTPTTIPADLWQSEIGVLLSRVRWWLSGDDLITISNAAALAFGENTQANRMRIARAMEQGLLEWVPDPSVANPQHNRRVLRPQVERLRDQRRLPE
jgi:hypothetical protein